MKKKIYAKTKEQLLLNLIENFNLKNRKILINSFFKNEFTPFEKNYINKNNIDFDYYLTTKNFDYFPERLKLLSIDYLNIIDYIYKDKKMWCSIGLNLQGRLYINKIINAFNLNLPKQITGIIYE